MSVVPTTSVPLITAPIVAGALLPGTRPPAAVARPAMTFPSFLAEVETAAAVDTRLAHCIQCGTCGGSCPSASAMTHTPRELFAMIRAGLRDDVLRSNTAWMCVSCYACTVRCPQEIHIPDVMYAVKSIAVREGVARSVAPAFSRTFVQNIHAFGRSYEVGLVARHYLRHFPLRLPGIAPTGVGMVASGRMGLLPHRIRGRKALRAIVARAGELEATR